MIECCQIAIIHDNVVIVSHVSVQATFPQENGCSDFIEGVQVLDLKNKINLIK